jgi:hypothetical protein
MFANMVLTPTCGGKACGAAFFYQPGVVEMLRPASTTAQFAFTRR